MTNDNMQTAFNVTLAKLGTSTRVTDEAKAQLICDIVTAVRDCPTDAEDAVILRYIAPKAHPVKGTPEGTEVTVTYADVFALAIGEHDEATDVLDRVIASIPSGRSILRDCVNLDRELKQLQRKAKAGEANRTEGERIKAIQGEKVTDKKGKVSFRGGLLATAKQQRNTMVQSLGRAFAVSAHIVEDWRVNSVRAAFETLRCVGTGLYFDAVTGDENADGTPEIAPHAVPVTAWWKGFKTDYAEWTAPKTAPAPAPVTDDSVTDDTDTDEGDEGDEGTKRAPNRKAEGTTDLDRIKAAHSVVIAKGADAKKELREEMLALYAALADTFTAADLEAYNKAHASND